MILMLDDESRQTDSYRMELEDAGYEVAYFDNVDDALLRFDADFQHISLVILDVMMPPGKAFRDADTKEGLRTGERFYDRVRARSQTVPVIILTNVSEKRFADRFGHEPHCHFWRKEDFLPFELADEVAKLVKGR